MCGGILGIAVAFAGMKLFTTIPIPTDIPISLNFALDRRVLLFTLVVAVASTFLFGLVPAWRSSRSDLATALRARDAEGTRRGQLWGRNVLVSSQLAASFLLLIISTVIFIGFRKELLQGPGFRTDHLYLMGFDSQTVHYTAAQNEQFFRRLLDKARSTPGIRSAAIAGSVPLGMNGDTREVIPEGRVPAPGQALPTVFDSVVSEDFLEIMQTPILRGRALLRSDTKDSPRVAVVNQHFATRFWPREDAIGKRFHLQTADGPLVQVVGVAKQGKYIWIGEPPLDFIYLPFSQNQQSVMTLIAESPVSDASALAPVLRSVVHDIDPNMPAFDARTINDLFAKRAIQTPKIIVEAVGGMGIMALVLAVIGLYGLIAYSVTRRTREIGIRMAVGADRRGVLQMILRQGFVLAISGIAAGVGLGILATRFVGSTFLVSSQRPSPLLFPAIMLPLLAAAMLAAYAPARRASRIDPMKALREE